jgi:hypothetical protein
MSIAELHKRSKYSRNQWRIFALFSFTFLFAIGLWTVDVGASAIANHLAVGTIFDIRNGLFQYHLGLGIAITSFFAVVLLLIKSWEV